MIVYVVRPNESVYDIAQLYGMDPETVIEDNGLENPDQLVAGQTLVLMTDTIPHYVTRGQSLYAIARAYGMLLAELQAANPQLTDPNRLEVGQEINVPVPSVKDGSIDVNGYAYPNHQRGRFAPNASVFDVSEHIRLHGQSGRLVVHTGRYGADRAGSCRQRRTHDGDHKHGGGRRFFKRARAYDTNGYRCA